jgi:hypothetical protein
MNIYLKKRKKSVFNSYKAVRASISLNNSKGKPAQYYWQEAIVVSNWEINWMEQVSEVKSDITPINQTHLKHNKMITKWWENN